MIVDCIISINHRKNICQTFFEKHCSSQIFGDIRFTAFIEGNWRQYVGMLHFQACKKTRKDVGNKESAFNEKKPTSWRIFCGAQNDKEYVKPQ